MEQVKMLAQKIKDFVNNNIIGNKDKKKVIGNCVVIILIGIMMLIVGGSIFSKGSQKQEKVEVTANEEAQSAAKLLAPDTKNELEKEIEGILSQINGVGRVSVAITYVSGKEIVPAYDTKKSESDTAEKDNGGGTRNIKQSDSENKVVYEDGQANGKNPIIVKELTPQVKGVVVVADGASNPDVKESLSRAVQALVDVPLHRIQVFERGNKEK